METVENDKHSSPDVENRDGTTFESAESFQRFMCDLFEKNGVLSDLRANLRRHIVTVLNSARTGEPPACQKHFSQRLELTYQAINMLVAEYLLCLDFTYSLSVFVSEIPLANMVFSFAQGLLQSDNETNLLELRFSDSDVWSLLNYLGIKCDSDNANNIVDVYKKQKQVPLLICILKCMAVCHKKTVYIENTSDVSASSSGKSSLSEEVQNVKRHHKYRNKCKHYAVCKLCQYRVSRLKGKYKKKKKCFVETTKTTEMKSSHVETFMKTVSVTEKSLINEMFEQLRYVYETEAEMCKAAQDKRVLRSIQSHVLQLKQRHDELEESYKTREEELERNVQQKKQFLWTLAQSLREQHTNMAKAMRAVKDETERLTIKEDNLKKQLATAEEILKKRGEEMREQITNELNILGGHLVSIKQERDIIDKERSELENLKAIRDTGKVNNTDELKSHYDLLKNEFFALKKHIESTKLDPKCVMERSTTTESIVLNNNQGLDRVRSDEDKVGTKTPNQVINDFKKHKNINFSPTDGYHEFNLSSASSEGGDAGYRHHHRHLQQFQDENERLRTHIAQQRDRIDEMASEQARLQMQVRTLQARLSSRLVTGAPWRATAAPLNDTYCALQRHSESVFGYKGGGEQLRVVPAETRAQFVVPGDALPFVGTRPRDARRRVVSPWHPHRRARTADTPGNVESNENVPSSTHKQYCDQTADQQTLNPASSSREHDPRSTTGAALKVNETREKSPQTLLREAKEKLKNKNSVKINPPPRTNEKSPTEVLREAKLRLRKLEIEAEAVEKSYLDYKKRQSELKEEIALEEDQITRDLDNDLSRPVQKLYCSETASYSHHREPLHSVREDFDKYLREYRTNFNLSETHFKNKNTAFALKRPIPLAFSNIDGGKEGKVYNDYIETPLKVFRKLYHIENTSQACMETQETDQRESPQRPLSPGSSVDSAHEANTRRKDSLKKAKFDKKAQLEILKQNINKIYNIKPPDNEDPEKTTAEANLLRVEVISKTSNIVAESSPNEELMLTVNSSIDRKVYKSDSDVEKENFSTQMTIVVSPKRVANPEMVISALSSPEVEEPDYPDDFSADVDNYNCRSDYDNHSPISPHKSSDDENFWDS